MRDYRRALAAKQDTKAAEAEIGFVRDQHRCHRYTKYRSKDHGSCPVSTRERVGAGLCEVLNSIDKVRQTRVKRRACSLYDERDINRNAQSRFK